MIEMTMKTPVMLPLVECLLPVVTKSFGQTSQCEWGEVGFQRWDLSSGVASRRGENSHSEPPVTQRGPSWAAHAPTGRRSRQVPGISLLPDAGSKHQTNITAALLEAVVVAHLCLTLCDPRDCSLTGSSVHGILQARILEWPSPSPGDIPDSGIKPGSPALQADSLLSHQGNTDQRGSHGKGG